MMQAIFRQSILVLLLLVAHPACRAQNNDIEWLRKINIDRNKSLDHLMIAITNSTYPIMVAEPVTELILGYSRHDKKLTRTGWVTVAGLCFTGALTYGIKYGVNRDPPYVTYPEIEPYGHTISPSFPSGHATFAFYSATELSLNYPKWYFVVPSYTWAVAVSYSRLHLGDHYPSDVFAGAVLGTASAWVTWKANKWLVRRKEMHDKKAERIRTLRLKKSNN